MADLPPYPNTDANEMGPERRRSRRAPMLGIIIAVAVVVLFVVLHLTGVIGPGSH